MQNIAQHHNLEDIMRLAEENVMILEKIFFLLKQENQALLSCNQKAFFTVQYAKLQSMEWYENLQLSLSKCIEHFDLNKKYTLRQIAEFGNEDKRKKLFSCCDTMQALSGQIRTLIETNNICMQKYAMNSIIVEQFYSCETVKAFAYNSKGKLAQKKGQILVSILK